MDTLFFFDDWLLHAREGLDRKQGQPQPVKEIALEKGFLTPEALDKILDPKQLFRKKK